MGTAPTDREGSGTDRDGRMTANQSEDLRWPVASQGESHQQRLRKTRVSIVKPQTQENLGTSDCLVEQVTELTGFRSTLAMIIKNQLFDLGIVSVIFMNFLFVVYETDLRARNEESVFATYAGHIFLMIYVVELAVRIYVHRSRYFASNQNKLDFCIVVLDCAAETVVVASQLPSVGWLRLFRIMRLLRTIRRMERFRELWLMLHGLACAVKAMMWACALIFCVLMMWSVVSIEVLKPMQERLHDAGAFNSCSDCIGAFDTVSTSIFTWFLIIFAGELWNTLVLPIVKEEPWTALVFFSGFVLVHIGLMNLILTVIVDRAAVARLEDEALRVSEKKAAFDKSKQKLLRLCDDIDTDNSGCVTVDELEQGFLLNDELQATLKAMDVGEDDLRTVFNILDADKSGTVTYDEFVMQLHKIKTQESHTLLIFITHYLQDVRVMLSEQIRLLKSDLAKTLDDHRAIGGKPTCGTGHPTAVDMYPTREHSEIHFLPHAVSCADDSRVMDTRCAMNNTSGPGDTTEKHILGMFTIAGDDTSASFDANMPRLPEYGALTVLDPKACDTLEALGSLRTTDAQESVGNRHDLGQTSEVVLPQPICVRTESQAGADIVERQVQVEGLTCADFQRIWSV